MAVTTGQPHRIEVHLAGPSIELWWDGVRVLQASDSFLMTSTWHGIDDSTLWDGISTFDNFSIAEPAPAVARVVVTAASAQRSHWGASTRSRPWPDAASNVIRTSVPLDLLVRERNS